MNTGGAKLVNQKGNGRSIIIVYEASGRFEKIAEELFKLLPESVRASLVAISQFAENNWQERALNLESTILTNKLKNSCFIAFGSSSSLVIHFSLTQLKLVRSLILVDATTRPHPTFITRCIDKIENYLPAGLPFRSHRRTFNAAPFLQHIRCPAAIVNTSMATSYHLAEAEVFKALLPTAWTKPIISPNPNDELKDFIIDFQNVAAKRPQKNLVR